MKLAGWAFLCALAPYPRTRKVAVMTVRSEGAQALKTSAEGQ